MADWHDAELEDPDEPQVRSQKVKSRQGLASAEVARGFTCACSSCMGAAAQARLSRVSVTHGLGPGGGREALQGLNLAPVVSLLGCQWVASLLSPSPTLQAKSGNLNAANGGVCGLTVALGCRLHVMPC